MVIIVQTMNIFPAGKGFYSRNMSFVGPEKGIFLSRKGLVKSNMVIIPTLKHPS